MNHPASRRSASLKEGFEASQPGVRPRPVISALMIVEMKSGEEHQGVLKQATTDWIELAGADGRAAASKPCRSTFHWMKNPILSCVGRA